MNTKIDAELGYSIPSALEYRIQDAIEVYEGDLPERFAIAWKAYLAGLMEWEVINIIDYSRLINLLPSIANDPIPDIFSSKESLNLRYESFEITGELQNRIQKHIDAFGGHLPESYTIAWNSYLSSLKEWQVIEYRPGNKLLELLPPISNPDPVLTIFLGRRDVDAFKEYIQEDMEIFHENLPERNAIAWKAYLRGLWEYGAISPKVYKQLLELLPTTINLEELKIFSERGQKPKSPGGIGFSTKVSDEMHFRIQQQLNTFQNNLPEDYLITWRAYLLSLKFWDVIDWSEYAELITLLPPIPIPDPVQRIASRNN